MLILNIFSKLISRLKALNVIYIFYIYYKKLYLLSNAGQSDEYLTLSRLYHLARLPTLSKSSTYYIFMNSYPTLARNNSNCSAKRALQNALFRIIITSILNKLFRILLSGFALQSAKTAKITAKCGKLSRINHRASWVDLHYKTQEFLELVTVTVIAKLTLIFKSLY